MEDGLDQQNLDQMVHLLESSIGSPCTLASANEASLWAKIGKELEMQRDQSICINTIGREDDVQGSRRTSQKLGQNESDCMAVRQVPWEGFQEKTLAAHIPSTRDIGRPHPGVGPHAGSVSPWKDGVFLGLSAFALCTTGTFRFPHLPVAPPETDCLEQGKESRPLVLLMQGFPGSGKSSIAVVLAKSLGWPLVDKDDARNCMGLLEDKLDRDLSSAQELLNELAYNVMWNVVSKQLQCGQSVVVDCPLMRSEVIQRAMEVTSHHNALAVIVKCSIKNETIWQQRLQNRREKVAQCELHKPFTWAEIQELANRYGEGWKVKKEWAAEIDLETGASSPEHLAKSVITQIKHLGLLKEHSSIHDLNTP